MLGKYLGYPCSKHFLVSNQFFLVMLFSYSSFSCVLRQGRAPPPVKHPVICCDLLCTWWYWFQTCRLWTEFKCSFLYEDHASLIFILLFIVCTMEGVHIHKGQPKLHCSESEGLHCLQRHHNTGLVQVELQLCHKIWM